MYLFSAYFYSESQIEVKSVKAGPTLCHCASNVEDYRITAFFSRLKGPRGLFGPMDPN